MATGLNDVGQDRKGAQALGVASAVAQGPRYHPIAQRPPGWVQALPDGGGIDGGTQPVGAKFWGARRHESHILSDRAQINAISCGPVKGPSPSATR